MGQTVEFVTRLFASYYGVKLYRVNAVGSIYESVNADFLMDVEINGVDNHLLALMPMSSMDDEMATKIAKYAIGLSDPPGFEVSAIKRLKGGIIRVWIRYDGLAANKNCFVAISDHGLPRVFEEIKFDESSRIQTFYQFPKQCVDTLRENGFDAGYGKFHSLIKAGFAINILNEKNG